MKTYSKEFINAFVDAYSRNVANASDEDVKAFLRDYAADMGWVQLRESHEYGSDIFDALCMFEAGMTFQENK